MSGDGTVRVRTIVVVDPGLSLHIDRDHGHFGAWVGKWWVCTDGAGNLVVRDHEQADFATQTILTVPA